MERKAKVTPWKPQNPSSNVLQQPISHTFDLFVGKIPPGSTLIFDIELMDIKNGPRSHDSFKEMDVNDDWKLSKEEV